MFFATQNCCLAAPDPAYRHHDRDRPQPPVVTPATPGTQDRPGRAPSDAVVLFDGKDISKWLSLDGTPAKWIVRDGYMESVKGGGDIRTFQNFGDCQLHVEWAAPSPARGEGQGRGNSGVFFGLRQYEVQVLDCYGNQTYPDGSAAAIYGQYPPLVNACLPPGQWQTYDIIYTAPRFEADGKLLVPARITLFHNGVLVQNNVELVGPTGGFVQQPYNPHPEKQPLALQDHGDAVRYRNIWVRELGMPGKKEFNLPDALLTEYAGSYTSSGTPVDITREGTQLIASLGGARFVLFADSPTTFFAKTTDVRFEFRRDQQGRVSQLIWSIGEGGITATKTR